eukprot:gene5302-8920_t
MFRSSVGESDIFFPAQDKSEVYDLPQKPEPERTTETYVSYFSIFKEPKLREAFHQYLIKEQSSENLDFIEAVENYQTTKTTTEEMISGLKEIHETFIKPGSDKEINITSSLRKKFLKKISAQLKEEKEWILDQPYYEVFLKIREVINGILIFDTFPRFLKSETSVNILQEFTTDTRIFYPCEITETDLEFMNILTKELQDFHEIPQKIKLKIVQYSVANKLDIIYHIQCEYKLQSWIIKKNEQNFEQLYEKILETKKLKIKPHESRLFNYINSDFFEKQIEEMEELLNNYLSFDEILEMKCFQEFLQDKDEPSSFDIRSLSDKKIQIYYTNVNFHPGSLLFDYIGCYKMFFKLPCSFDQTIFAFTTCKILEKIHPSFKIKKTFEISENNSFQTEIDFSKKIPQKFHFLTTFQFDSSSNTFSIIIKPFTPNYPSTTDYLAYFHFELTKKRQDLTILQLVSYFQMKDNDMNLIKRYSQKIGEYLNNSISHHLKDIPDDFNLSNFASSLDEKTDIGHKLLLKLNLIKQIKQKAPKNMRLRKGGFVELEQLSPEEQNQEEKLTTKKEIQEKVE